MRKCEEMQNQFLYVFGSIRDLRDLLVQFFPPESLRLPSQ